jgi:hypothetical protein
VRRANKKEEGGGEAAGARTRGARKPRSQLRKQLQRRQLPRHQLVAQVNPRQLEHHLQRLLLPQQAAAGEPGNVLVAVAHRLVLLARLLVALQLLQRGEERGEKGRRGRDQQRRAAQRLHDRAGALFVLHRRFNGVQDGFRGCR